MIYKYIFYKIYHWVNNWFDPIAPKITTTLILSLLPLSILYTILRIVSYLNIFQFSMRDTRSPIVIAFAVILIVLIAFNQVYFFSYNNWKEIIIFFREHEIPRKSKIAANVYIIFCTSIYIILFMFLGYNF